MVKLNPKSSSRRKKIQGKWLSLIYLGIFVSLIMADFIFGSFYYSGELREGDISLRSIFAPYDFRYPWGIDEEKTGAAREHAKRDVPLIFNIDNSLEEKVISNLSALFTDLEAIKNAKKPEKQAAIGAIKARTGYDIPERELVYLSYRNDREMVLSALADILKNIYPFGIMNTVEAHELSASAKAVKIVNKRLLQEQTLSVDEIISVDKAKELARGYADKKFSHDRRLRDYVSDILDQSIISNVIFNRDETESAREETAKSVPSSYSMLDVKKNEIILERGKRISREHIVKLQQVGVLGGVTNRWPYFSGIFILIALFLVFLNINFLGMTERNVLNKPKESLIILINCLVIFVIGQFIIQSSYNNLTIPLAGTAMLLCLLISPNAALSVSLALSLFLGILAKEKLDIVIVFMLSSFAAVYMVRDARRRSKIMLAGLISGAVSAVSIIGLGLINNVESVEFLKNAAWGLTGGIVSIFYVMGLLPVFEYIFKVTTNITLLELSDLNNPVLKELTLKAPGTYQHSIMVGNLAEAACDAINANSLLARVGSYYHDIGKIGKAEYFSENEVGGVSKHEKLTPSMSALIIVNHVKDGVELAGKNKMNPKIIEFIAQHHGTGLIYYFYHRALQITEEGVLREEEFRYPGPKPQTREAAIVLLADSVEASSRALDQPTPSRIVGLVQKIINNKFIDNQLDECDLTLKDLNKIAESFVRVLTAVFHTRLVYPDMGQTRGDKKDVKIKLGQPEQKKTL